MKDKHEHKMTIFDLYQTFAVCNTCGFHDYGTYDEEDELVTDFNKKYPGSKTIDFDEVDRV